MDNSNIFIFYTYNCYYKRRYTTVLCHSYFFEWQFTKNKKVMWTIIQIFLCRSVCGDHSLMPEYSYIPLFIPSLVYWSFTNLPTVCTSLKLLICIPSIVYAYPLAVQIRFVNPRLQILIIIAVMLHFSFSWYVFYESNFFITYIWFTIEVIIFVR